MWLIDTNILVYAVSPSEKTKYTIARSFIAEILTNGEGVLAVQNCVEFINAAALKPKSPLSLSDAFAALDTWTKYLAVLSPNFDTVRVAVNGVDRYQLSYWDALIWAVAVQNGLEGIFSEDGPTGATINGIRWVDPLRP